jgi:hypothetical protein
MRTGLSLLGTHYTRRPLCFERLDSLINHTANVRHKHRTALSLITSLRRKAGLVR